jgi:hypothetical protein
MDDAGAVSTNGAVNRVPYNIFTDEADNNEEMNLDIATENDDTGDEEYNKGAINRAVKKSSKMAKNFSYKAHDFTDSTVSRINEIPESMRDRKIKAIIDKAKDRKTITGMLSNGVKQAGKGVALAGLAMVCLPAAIGVFLVSKHIDARDKQAAVEDLIREMKVIDIQLQKAKNDGDHNRQADLIIAKRVAEQAYHKLKYGLKHLPTKHYSDNGD